MLEPLRFKLRLTHVSRVGGWAHFLFLIIQRGTFWDNMGKLLVRGLSPPFIKEHLPPFNEACRRRAR
jgi:hypothetical protein